MRGGDGRQRAPSLPLSPPMTETAPSTMDDATAWMPHRRTSSIHYGTTPRTAATESSKLLIIVPPSHIPHDPPPIAAQHARGFGAPSRFAEGVLLPLQATLGGQLTAIAREYGLPSILGLSLHLNMTDDGRSFKPKVTEEAWTACWAAHLASAAASAGERSSIMRPSLRARPPFALWNLLKHASHCRQGRVRHR
jgi:hypothetical protein